MIQYRWHGACNRTFAARPTTKRAQSILTIHLDRMKPVLFPRVVCRHFGTTVGVVAALCLAASHLHAATIINYGEGRDKGPEIVGSGHVVSETRPVGPFHALAQKLSGNVVITQGDHEGLVVEGEDNILPLVETTVDAEGTLHLGIKKQAGRITFEKDLVFKVAVKSLDKIELAGSGKVQAASLSADHLDLRLLGSSDVSIDHLMAHRLTVAIDGLGEVKLAGNVQSQTLAINGSGDYRGRNLKTEDTRVTVNGSGAAQVWAEKTLDTAVHGSGDVSHRGAAKPTKEAHGMGTVHPLSDDDKES